MIAFLLRLLAAHYAAHTRALLAEAAAGCPGDGEDLVVGSDELFDVARAVGGTSPIYDGLLAEEFAREIDFRLDDVVREWSADV